MAKWKRKSPLINNLFEWSKEKFYAKWSPAEWWAVARTASKKEGIQGRHADNQLVIIDEVSGMDDAGINVKHFQPDDYTYKPKKKINITSSDPGQHVLRLFLCRHAEIDGRDVVGRQRDVALGRQPRISVARHDVAGRLADDDLLLHAPDDLF